MIRDPMMGMNPPINPGINISPRSSAARNPKFDTSSTLGTPSILPGDPTFPDSLLSDSFLMGTGRLYSGELDLEATHKPTQPQQQQNTISIDVDTDDSLDETFEFTDKLGELQTMKKEKVMKKMRKRSHRDAKSVIVIDDHSSEGGSIDTSVGLGAPGHGAHPLGDLGTFPIDDIPTDLVTSHESLMRAHQSDALMRPTAISTSTPLSTTLGTPITNLPNMPLSSGVTMPTGLADIKMSIANINAANSPKGINPKTDIVFSPPPENANVIGHITKLAASAEEMLPPSMPPTNMNMNLPLPLPAPVKDPRTPGHRSSSTR